MGRIVGGGVACLIGIVWILQGLDIRKGDGMSGEGEWAFLGALLLLLGAAVVIGGLRVRRSKRG
ncbi:MAG TPA: hypothetical protein VJ804_08805 [Acidimicrobiales bacterium]|nr:hypothetical protein [Acidimicrobiales bacterium]